MVGEVDSGTKPPEFCQLLDTERATFCTMGISWEGDMAEGMYRKKSNVLEAEGEGWKGYE
jgi:hypothetical protein